MDLLELSDKHRDCQPIAVPCGLCTHRQGSRRRVSGRSAVARGSGDPRLASKGGSFGGCCCMWRESISTLVCVPGGINVAHGRRADLSFWDCRNGGRIGQDLSRSSSDPHSSTSHLKSSSSQHLLHTERLIRRQVWRLEGTRQRHATPENQCVGNHDVR